MGQSDGRLISNNPTEESSGLLIEEHSKKASKGNSKRKRPQSQKKSKTYFKCSKCGKKFRLQFSYNQHMKTHEDEEETDVDEEEELGKELWKRYSLIYFIKIK